MSPWHRRSALAGGVVAMAGALLILGSPPVKAPPTPVASDAPSTDPVARAIAGLQTDLRRTPGNAKGWSQLGLAYVQQARLTADPSYYPKAAGAFERSLTVQPRDNATALVGQATLAAARHDFPAALRLVNASLKLNDYSATAYGVKADALTELGRYDDAAAAVQRMLDLRPGVDAFARASYQRELRGDIAGAREAMQKAADDAASPADKAFSLYYLGELAWNNGDQRGARRHYDAALAADPAYLPALTGQAKALAAAGQPTAALASYREAVQAQPQPAYVVELGELLEASGQRGAAKEQYDVVRATEQLFAASGANVDLELALFEADHGTAADALRYAQSAYRTRPDSILTEDAYGWALHRAGRDREALVQARRAQRLGTRLPILRYHLGVIEAALGDKTPARRDLQAALALNPSFNPLQAPAARALLTRLA
jgi:tetratricopeptide (TPR) repeat protein